MKKLLPYIILIAAAFLLGMFLSPKSDKGGREALEMYRKDKEASIAREQALRLEYSARIEAIEEKRVSDSVNHKVQENASNAEIRYWKKKANGVNFSGKTQPQLDSVRFIILKYMK